MDKFYENMKNFWDIRSEKENFLWRNDLTPFKVNFIKNNIKSNALILDLGAGDLSLDFELVDFVKKITAVDYAAVINTKFHSKIETHQQDVTNFILNCTEKYDHILIIGVMNFIQNSSEFYSACKNCLLKSGSLIIAHQCGKYEDILVNSLVDGDSYSAIYPYWNKEKNILESLGFSVNVVDPYPKMLNKHDNTEFKGFICKI